MNKDNKKTRKFLSFELQGKNVCSNDTNMKKKLLEKANNLILGCQTELHTVNVPNRLIL